MTLLFALLAGSFLSFVDGCWSKASENDVARAAVTLAYADEAQQFDAQVQQVLELVDRQQSELAQANEIDLHEDDETSQQAQTDDESSDGVIMCPAERNAFC